MNLKDLVVGGIAVVALLVGFAGMSSPNPTDVVNQVIEKVNKFSAAPGPDVYVPTWFAQTVTIGGNVFATSSAGAVTYTAASLNNVNTIQHTATGALTATLPASSTLTSFVPKAGDSRTVFLNPITTGITLAGGTGTDLNTASSTKFCVVGSLCRLDFVRKSNTDIEVLLTSSTGL